MFATALYTAGEFVASNVLAPITAAGSVEEARENPTKMNVGLAILATTPYAPKSSGKIIKKLLGKEAIAGEKLLTKEVSSGATVLEAEVISVDSNLKAQPITDPRRLLPPPTRSNPHLDGASISSEILPVGYKYNQAVSPGQRTPGRFGTDAAIPDVDFARNDLAVTEGFKKEISGVREVEVVRPVVGQRSVVGPQEYAGKIYQGGAPQIEILDYDPVRPFVRFVGEETPILKRSK